MKSLVFALQFRGSAGPVEGQAGQLQAKTSASSQTLRTILSETGVEAAVDAAGGGSASFESLVQVVGEGTFQEPGTITHGTAGTVTFKTVGRGVLGDSGMPGLQRGAVIWEVTGGQGQFAGATGLITSNFSVGAQGEVIDNQFAQLFLPA